MAMNGAAINVFRAAAIFFFITALSPCALAKRDQTAANRTKLIQHETLTSYVERMRQQSPDLLPRSSGSLWTDQGRFSNLAADDKALHVGDLLIIVVSQGTTANSAASVSTNRAFNASSSITGLAAHATTTAVQNIFSPNSAATLSGKSQASTTSTLQTSLAGRVVAVLPSGILVVEAERQLTMNNEKQTVLLRGLVRPGDIAPDGSVPSNDLGNLELELKGKGVLSDGVRPPNPLVRGLLWLLGF
jgi:flagellar L-ring protein FlgH